MLSFAQTCEAIGSTTKKLEKTRLVAEYLKSVPPDQAAIAAVFLSGHPFPAYRDSPLGIGGSLLWRTIAELSGESESKLTDIYRRYGDVGAVAAAALPAIEHTSIKLANVQQAFEQIASTRTSEAKGHLLRQLMLQASPLEAKYIVKIISGDLRIGLKESLVEDAIAYAFEVPLDHVKRANMLLGDIGQTLQLAAIRKLSEAHMRLFHPIDFMLASPTESADEALSYFENAQVENKYDGIRAHAHIGNGEVRLFSRTRDEITDSFPEIPPALTSLPQDAILDGEIVAWSCVADAHVAKGALPGIQTKQSWAESGRALPFSTLQQRLGRKKVSEKILRDCPVAYLVFDVLYAGGELLLDRPLRDRGKILDQLLAQCGAGIPAHENSASQIQSAQRTHAAGPSQSHFGFATPDIPPASILRSPVSTARSPEEIEGLFLAARARGNEGLMIKDFDSPYTPGRRGKSWLKMKRELATLDVVVTAVEYGHGKRIGVLSDYTFAVWDGDRLVNIGKAYSGLADAEIAEMTKWFLAHVTRDQGFRLEVEPKIVLEVAFNNMMRSDRHDSGYALRFPRIVRLRSDKLPEDADTVETVKQIYERQHHT
jgi:DNA ligase-1